MKCLESLQADQSYAVRLWNQLQSCSYSVSSVLKQDPPWENVDQPLITKKVIKNSECIVSGFELNI